MPVIDVVTRDFGGGALARAALAKCVPTEWYESLPSNIEGWRSVARIIAAQFKDIDWVNELAPALSAQGAAAHRLARSANGRGLVVTTGQQPGLFGGPLYTWSKALTALALANALEEHLKIPVAPVFWAATDDADFAEASYTVIAHAGEVATLRMAEADTGLSMADTPLGDVSAQYAVFAQAAGSVIDHAPLQAVQASYVASHTVGSSYVMLLRALMEPLGISVLDAAHPAVRSAAAPVVQRALQHAPAVRDALAERSVAIEQAGYRVQVQPVPNLSLVFSSGSGARKRIPVKEAARLAGNGHDANLGPNVLLRPVVERSILPTITYVAGPAEFAYFAQVSAVADALGAPRPRVVPRWSGMVMEPQVQEILNKLGATIDDFQDPHAIEGRVAREELPTAVRDAIVGLRDTVHVHATTLRTQQNALQALRKSVSGFEAQVEHRIARLERRFAAAVKHSGNARLHDVAVARASLYPNGVPQERALNAIPFFARYGTVVRERMLAAATQHVHTLLTHG